MPEDIFITYPAKVAFKTYQTRWQLGDIYISGNAKPTEDNPQGLGCYLVMTGRGCDDIFNILDSHNRTFGHMFHQCVRWLGTEFHFTRLDIAIDDRNEVPFFTPAQIRKKFEKEEFVSTSDFYHFDDSKYDTDDLARTAYLGSGKSAISYRFYDKDREVSAKYNKSLDEIGNWKRFLGNVEPLKLHIPKAQNSLLETQQWLTDGGVISAVKGFYFLEEHDALGELKTVGEMLDKARYSPPLSSKLTGHLQRIGREELIPHIQYDTKTGKGGAV